MRLEARPSNILNHLNPTLNTLIQPFYRWEHPVFLVMPDCGQDLLKQWERIGNAWSAFSEKVSMLPSSLLDDRELMLRRLHIVFGCIWCLTSTWNKNPFAKVNKFDLYDFYITNNYICIKHIRCIMTPSCCLNFLISKSSFCWLICPGEPKICHDWKVPSSKFEVLLPAVFLNLEFWTQMFSFEWQGHLALHHSTEAFQGFQLWILHRRLFVCPTLVSLAIQHTTSWHTPVKKAGRKKWHQAWRPTKPLF